EADRLFRQGTDAADRAGDLELYALAGNRLAGGSLSTKDPAQRKHPFWRPTASENCTGWLWTARIATWDVCAWRRATWRPLPRCWTAPWNLRRVPGVPYLPGTSIISADASGWRRAASGKRSTTCESRRALPASGAGPRRPMTPPAREPKACSIGFIRPWWKPATGFISRRATQPSFARRSRPRRRT